MLAVLHEKQKSELLEFIKERFEINENVFTDHEFYSGHKGKVFLGPTNIGLDNYLSVGFEIARLGRKIKLSSSFAQLFGLHAKKNALYLTKENAINYMNGYSLILENSETESCSNGLVFVFYQGLALGSGLLVDTSLKNMLPKAKRTEIRFI